MLKIHSRTLDAIVMQKRGLEKLGMRGERVGTTYGAATVWVCTWIWDTRLGDSGGCCGGVREKVHIA